MKKLSLLSALALVFALGAAFAAEPSEENAMQKVLGIGGLFFKSENPARLAR